MTEGKRNKYDKKGMKGKKKIRGYSQNKNLNYCATL